jgi:hypothetical protein
MISTVWRERLIYTVMSVFVAWHSLAIVVTPASPDSVTAQGLRALLQPYLTLLWLDNSWAFFSPSVNTPFTSRQLAYVIEDKAGKKLFLTPEAEYGGLEPKYFWFRAWHLAVIDKPEDYADIAAAFYCRKHAALQPMAITLMGIVDEDFTVADFLAGESRWGPEFVTVNTIKNVKCPAS